MIGATTNGAAGSEPMLDTNRYPAGRTVSDDELEAIYLVETLSMVNGIIRCYPALRCSIELIIS